MIIFVTGRYYEASQFISLLLSLPLSQVQILFTALSSSQRARDQVSYPYKAGNIVILYTVIFTFLDTVPC